MEYTMMIFKTNFLFKRLDMKKIRLIFFLNF